MTIADWFWLSMMVVLAIIDLSATYLVPGGPSFSSRVRFWSARYPQIILVYVLGAITLAWHFWGPK